MKDLVIVWKGYTDHNWMIAFAKDGKPAYFNTRQEAVDTLNKFKREHGDILADNIILREKLNQYEGEE